MLIISALLVSFMAFIFPFGKYGYICSIMRTLSFLPFFIGGYVLHSKGFPLTERQPRWLTIILVVLSLLCFSFCCIFSTRVLHVLEFNNADVWYMSAQYSVPVTSLLLFKILVFIGAIITSYLVLQVVKLPQSVCIYGSKTLAYFVLQGIFAHILAACFQPKFMMALILGVIILILSTLILRFFDAKYITNPVSSILFEKK